MGRDFGLGQFLLVAVLDPRQVPDDEQKRAGAQGRYELVWLHMQLRIHQTGHGRGLMTLPVFAEFVASSSSAAAAHTDFLTGLTRNAKMDENERLYEKSEDTGVGDCGGLMKCEALTRRVQLSGSGFYVCFGGQTKLQELGLLYDRQRAILMSLFFGIGQLHPVSEARCVDSCDTHFTAL